MAATNASGCRDYTIELRAGPERSRSVLVIRPINDVADLLARLMTDPEIFVQQRTCFRSNRQLLDVLLRGHCQLAVVLDRPSVPLDVH